MIKIITDTAADINITQAAAMGVELVPILVHFKGADYQPLADQDFSQFYRLLEEHKDLPTTSQPAPGDYLAHFLKARAEGAGVVVITLSSALSGTFQSATLAKEMADYDDIYIVDSLQATLGQRLLVEYAVKLRGEGATAADIAATIGEAAHRVKLYAALDTLKYLRKGGRIPRSAELLGSALGIKPIITIDAAGAVAMVGKTRGRAGAVTSLVRLIEENGHPDPAMPVAFGYTQSDLSAKSLRKLVAQKLGLKKSTLQPVGPVIGTHVGPGASAVVWLDREQNI